MGKTGANELTVARGAGLVEAEVDGELIGIHIENGTYYSFNASATRIWQLIEQPRSLANLCAALAEEFDVDPATCESDVRRILDDLASDGIVRLG